jgi:hypothetical protein
MYTIFQRALIRRPLRRRSRVRSLAARDMPRSVTVWFAACLAGLAVMALAPAGASAARGPVPPTIVPVRTRGPVIIDGRLDEESWTAAPVDDAFTQQYPVEGAAPSERTELRVLYDDRALYVGIICFEKSAPVVARLTRRDRVVASDRVTVDISSRGDRLTAFHFGVNAAGVLDDGIYFDDTSFSADWDENWEAATSIGPAGWSVEIRIPFRILRFDAAPRQRWGFEVERYSEGRHEWDHWSFHRRAVAGFVSTFGTLEGLEGIRPSRPFEVRLGGLLRLRHRDAEVLASTPGPARDWHWDFEVGGKAHPTQGTTLDMTVNPDFGQVEADQVILNLTTTELVYPEKRPFFLEGIDTFATPRTILYTRRIGAQPSAPTLASGELLADTVNPSRIWGAAKLVGAVGPRTNIGLLTALTGENSVEVEGADMSRTSREVDPRSLFNAVRARRLWGQGGDVGVLATAVNRFESGPDRLKNDAYVTAVDGHWHSPGADYLLAGQLVAALLERGSAKAQPDGIDSQPGHLSLGATLTAAKQGGEHWLASTSQAISGRELDYNDFGYLDRKNDYNGYADLTYRTLTPWWKTTDTYVNLALSHRQTLDGISLGDNVRVQGGATFKNFWVTSAAVYFNSRYFDDRETGKGLALERAPLWGAEWYLASDTRNLISGALWLQARDIADGAQYAGSAAVFLRPLSRLELELDPTAFFTSGEPRFMQLDGGTYRFGKLRATDVGLTVRSTVGLLPTLTFQLYGQVFLATKHFADTSSFVPGGAGPVRAELHLGQLTPDPVTPVDSQQAVLNVNAVLRWEYRLGSVIFLVYTRAQSPTIPATSPGFPRLELAPLSGNRGSTDILLLKASYWWG